MNKSESIRVLIVDDHTIVREGIVTLLEAFPDLTLAGEAANGQEAVKLCAEQNPDVVLMDLMMPVMDGVTAIRKILKDHPDIRILALTSFVENEMVQTALEAGAFGYLLKNISARELTEAIRAAKAGRSSLAPEATQVLIKAATAPPPLGYDLTPRELEILQLLVGGLTNAQIAQQLSISPATVKNHVSNILPKLNASGRTEAVSLALQHKLVSPS